MSDYRELNDSIARSAAGAACLLQARDEFEARAEADCWGWNSFEWGAGRSGRDAAERAIERHCGRVVTNIFTRSHE